MSDPAPSRPRDNTFLIAAVALPLVVVGLFLVASAVPRWTVPPPTYDLVIRADGGYQPSPSQVVVAFRVRDGRLEADLLPAVPNTYPPEPSLFVIDHRTGDAREIALDLPVALTGESTARAVVVEALAARRVLEGPRAPDGYRFEHRSGRGPGVVGEIFGMRRYGEAAAIVKDGRVVPIELPPPYRYAVEPIGWLEPEGGR
jgi:hypothetical protein